MRIKRRYMLLLSFILSLALVSPILYPKWSERRRLKKIEEIRKEAVKQEGMELKDALKLFETENPSLIILFTGNTKGYLETCGCFEGQSGGVARRATVIKRLRKKTPILLVDAGGILQGDEPLDRLRTKVYLECMRKMGYDAICPEGDEIDLLSKSSITLISANVHTTGIVPSLIKRVGGVQIGILGLSKPEGAYSEEVLITSLQGELSRLRKKADIVLLLSNLPVLEIRKVAEEVKGIDYIISSERGDQEKIDETYLLFSSPKGERLGFLAMKLPSMKTFSGSILLGDDVPDDQEIRAILNQFYKTVARNKRYQREGKLLSLNGNRYIGSEECRSCHTDEYDQWSQTPHAGAYRTLLRKNRYFYPDCVICHTTGFGYETGYQIGDERSKKLAGVGCESCHGPGRKHSFNPTKENIKGKVRPNVCTRCHTPEHSPGFDRLEKLLWKEVDHSQKIVSFDQLIAQHARGTLKPKLELFVMSFCPFGVAAERELIPKVREYRDKIDFKIYFIAEKAESKKEEIPFKSMHGEAELMEDIRQVVMQELYPDKFFDYLLCRAKDLKASWTKCAVKVGIDVGKVNRTIESGDGLKWFEENMKRTEELDIRASPTLLLNGKRVSIWGILGKRRGGLCE